VACWALRYSARAAKAAEQAARAARRAAESAHISNLTNVRAHSDFDKAKAWLERVDTTQLSDDKAECRRQQVREYMQLFTMIHFLLETKGIDDKLARSFVTLREVCLLLGKVRAIVQKDSLDYDPRIFERFQRLFAHCLDSSPVPSERGDA
jgi:hypothetical protein